MKFKEFYLHLENIPSPRFEEKNWIVGIVMDVVEDSLKIIGQSRIQWAEKIRQHSLESNFVFNGNKQNVLRRYKSVRTPYLLTQFYHREGGGENSSSKEGERW